MGFMDFLGKALNGAVSGIQNLESQAIDDQRRYIKKLSDAQLRHAASHAENSVTRRLCEEEMERRDLL